MSARRKPGMRTVLLASMLYLPAATALADRLVMKNGDVISGDIKQIWDREIAIEPSYADEFFVDVDAVAYIEAERNFEIEFRSGRNMVAQLLGADEEGNQVLAVGDQILSVPLEELMELEEPDEYFEWESHVDVSVGINKGNTDSQNGRFRTDGRVKIGDHRHTAELIMNRQEEEQETIKEQDIFRYTYNWLFDDPWFFGLSADLERDPVRELDHRAIFAAGLGRDIWDDANRTLRASLGLGYQNEQISQEESDSATVIWNLEFAHDLLGGAMETFHNQTIFTNVSGRSNTVAKTSTGASYEITDLLYASISLDYDYESNPADLAENEDLTLLFGLGLEFE